MDSAAKIVSPKRDPRTGDPLTTCTPGSLSQNGSSVTLPSRDTDQEAT